MIISDRSFRSVISRWILIIAIFSVQLPFGARFEVAYWLAGIAILYYALVALKDAARSVAIALVALLFVLAALVQMDIINTRYLLALAEFYDFFFPILFAGSGLWLLLER